MMRYYVFSIKYTRYFYKMFITTHQKGKKAGLTVWPPVHIVSLVPSQTELLHYLGLENEVVGITKFCVHPRRWLNTKARVGGTKTVNLDAVKALNPQLIIANKEENVKEQVEALAEIGPVWVSDVNNLAGALDMIKAVGGLVDKTKRANELVNQIQRSFATLVNTNQLISHSTPALNVAYLIWRQPYMTVGGDTFINDMLKHCGFKNVFEDKRRYPIIELEQLKKHNCSHIFLSSEPYPFKQHHAEEIKKLLPNAQVVFVDGEMFSWYGSRLLLAVQYFKELKQNLSNNNSLVV